EMNFFAGGGHTALLEIHGQFPVDKRCKCVWRGMAAGGGANARETFLDAEGFGDVVVGAGIEGDALVALGAANGEHDNGNVAGTADFAAGFDATHPWKIHVEKNEVGLEFNSGFEGFLPRGDFADSIAAERKSRAQHAANLRFVIHDQDGGRTHRDSLQTGATGSVKEKTEPLPCWLVTENVPPWADTMALAIGKPMPVPRTW